MNSEGLGEMFEGDSADTCAGKIPLVSMGGRAEGLACADPGARTPIGASRNFLCIFRGVGGSHLLSKITHAREWLENAKVPDKVSSIPHHEHVDLCLAGVGDNLSPHTDGHLTVGFVVGMVVCGWPHIQELAAMCMQGWQLS